MSENGRDSSIRKKIDRILSESGIEGYRELNSILGDGVRRVPEGAESVVSKGRRKRVAKAQLSESSGGVPLTEDGDEVFKESTKKEIKASGKRLEQMQDVKMSPVDLYSEGFSFSSMDMSGIVSQIRSLGREIGESKRYVEEMAEHPVISSAIELYVEDAFQVDEDKNRTVWVESVNSVLQEELQGFLDFIDLEQQIESWARSVFIYGEIFFKDYVGEWLSGEKDPKLPVKIEDIYFEWLSPEMDFYHLFYKGRSAGYLVESNDSSGEGFELCPDLAYVHAFSYRDFFHKKIRVADKDGNVAELVYMNGTSFLRPLFQIYKVIRVVEDQLLSARVASSDNFRIVQYEVGDSSTKQARAIESKVRNTLERSFKFSKGERASFDVSPIQQKDMVFLPKRNGKGMVDIIPVGGDLTVGEGPDIDYFRNQFYGALRIPKIYLGYEEALPGSLGNTSLTKLDIRYARSVKRLKRIVMNFIKMLVDRYLLYTDQIDKIGQYTLKSVKVSSAEEADRTAELSERTDVASRLMDLVGNMGVQSKAFYQWIISVLLGIPSDLVDFESGEGGTPPEGEDNFSEDELGFGSESGEEESQVPDDFGSEPGEGLLPSDEGFGEEDIAFDTGDSGGSDADFEKFADKGEEVSLPIEQGN